MSLYGMLNPESSDRSVLLAVIGFPDVGRYRDAWVEKDEGGPVLAVYTRNGGGNRESYSDVIDDLQNHPQYLSDEDDDYDCTYATFRFRVPDEFREVAEQIAGDRVNMSDRWQEFIAALEKRNG